MHYNVPYYNIGTTLILPQSCHLFSAYLADLWTSYPYSPAATYMYLTPPGVTLSQPERKPLGTGTWKTLSGGQYTPGDYHLLQLATMYVFKTRQVHIPTSGTKQASPSKSVNLTNMLSMSKDPVKSPFATASSWGDMSLSKHHNLGALSVMTSDTLLSCLPSLLPHPPCGQPPACPLLHLPTSQPPERTSSQSPPSTVPTTAAPAHLSPSYPETAVTTPSGVPPEPTVTTTTRDHCGAPSAYRHPTIHSWGPISLDTSHAQTATPQDSTGIEETKRLQQERP